jgi:hypothetical protein
MPRIILGNEQIGDKNQLKTVRNFIRRNAQIGYGSEDQKSVKRKEEKHLLNFCYYQSSVLFGQSSRNDSTRGHTPFYTPFLHCEPL